MIRFPSTRLGRLARAKTRQEAMEHCNIYYEKTVPEYFFDRNPENFSSILGEELRGALGGRHAAITLHPHSRTKPTLLRRAEALSVEVEIILVSSALT